MITQKELKEMLSYDKNTGIFTWVKPKKFTKHITIAGCIKSKKERYVYIQIGGRNYRAHRLAWLYIHGVWPYCIDHINGDGSDNRIKNLRDVTHLENSRNRRMQKNNTSGITGVTFKKRDNKWQSKIKIKGREKSLGYFEDFFEACCARKSAERAYGFHMNHGKVRDFNQPVR